MKSTTTIPIAQSNITIQDIQLLLDNYDKEKGFLKKGISIAYFDLELKKDDAKIIVKIRNFYNKLSKHISSAITFSPINPLGPSELYELNKILASRKRDENNLSDKLCHGLEEKIHPLYLYWECLVLLNKSNCLSEKNYQLLLMQDTNKLLALKTKLQDDQFLNCLNFLNEDDILINHIKVLNWLITLDNKKLFQFDLLLSQIKPCRF